MAGSEFQSLEVKGIKELAKARFRFLFNLTAKGVLSVRKPRVSSEDGFRRDN